MAKKKRKNSGASANAGNNGAGANNKNNVPLPARPRNIFRSGSFWAIVALCVCWLVQFYPVVFGVGGVHYGVDIAFMDFPVRYFSRTALLSGQFPHWVPYVYNGMPFFAAMFTGFFYPINLLVSLMQVNDNTLFYIISFFIMLHYLIAGISMFAYLRYKRRSCAASFFGAVSFMLCGFMMGHLIHSSMVSIMAWFPLTLLLFERCIRDCNFKSAVVGGLLFGLSNLAVHPQLFFYLLIFLFSIGVYLLYRLRDKLVKRIATITVFFSIVGGLCLVAYLPTVEMIDWTNRVEYTVESVSEGSMPPAQFLTALMPKFFGSFTGPALGKEVPKFWLENEFTRGYQIFWESSFYFGIAVLILSLLWFRKVRTDSVARFALLWVVGSLCIALGGHFFVYRLLFEMGVPGFTSFRYPSRFLVSWCVLFPLMAAAALDRLDELKSGKLKIASLSVCAVLALAGIVAAAGGFARFFPEMAEDPERARYAARQGLVLFMNAALAGLVLGLFFRNVIKLQTAKILFAACVAIDMLVFAAGLHVQRNEKGALQIFTINANEAKQLKAMQDEELFRLNSRPFALTPGVPVMGQSHMRFMEVNHGLVSDIFLVEGDHPLRLRLSIPRLNAEKFKTVLDLMNVKIYANPNFDFRRDVSEQEMFFLNPTFLPRAKLFYRAKVIGESATGGWDEHDSLILGYMNSDLYDHRNEVVVTDQSFARFSEGENGGGSVKITDYKLNKIELDVDTDREAILWMSEIWYPAWKATVNGEKTKVHRANYSFRAVTVPAGKSKVVFKFDSIYFNIGAVISLLTLVVALGYLVLTRKAGGNAEGGMRKAE